MKDDKTKLEPTDILRKKAEELLKKNILSPDSNLSDAQILKLIHELDVHQIELEMQNEELLIAKKQAEIDAEKYTNLYDFAPTGYITLSKDGEITNLNFRGANFLGKERSFLKKRRFALFVSDETRPVFNLFLEKLIDQKTKENCEVVLSTISEHPIDVMLTGISSEDGEECYITMIDISKSKKAEKATKISEEKYHTLFDSNKDSITIFKLEPNGKPGNFIEANPATTALFGFTKKEILSLNVRDIESISEKKLKARVETLLSKGRIDFETIIKNKNGNKRNVEIETVIINYLNEPAVMNITRDITERKQMENNVKKANESLITILEAIPDLLFEVGLDGRIYHYQSHRDDLLAVPQSEFMGKLFQDVLPADVAIVCLEAIHEANEKGWSIGKQYSLDLPKGKFWFELSVSPIKEGVDKYKHFILLARDITERKVAEEKLRTEKNRIRTILEMVGNPIFLKDNDHKITYANNAFYNLFGLNEKNVIGKTLAENVPENERKHFLKVDRNVLDTGIPDIREEELTRKGIVHTIITSKTRFVDESGIKSLVGSIYDITERKKYEQALQKSQEKLRGVFELANSGIILTDLKGKYLLFNNWLMDNLGYKREELNKLTREDITHPDDLEKSNMLFEEIIEGKLDRYQLEKRFVRKDGSCFWGEISVSAIKDKNNKVVNTVGIITDISERRRDKEALQKSEEKLQGIFNLANSGIVLSNSEGHFLEFNHWWTNNLGYSSEELSAMTNRDITHPDDFEKSNLWFNKIIEGKIDKYQIEKRYVRKNKSCFWVDISLSAIKDENNKIINTVGVATDITERKNAEEKLKLSESRLISAQSVAKVGNWETDLIFKNIVWSDETYRIFGLNPDKDSLSLESFMSLVHPDDLKMVESKFVHSIKSNVINSVEHQIITPDGILKYVEQRWKIMHDDQGNPVRAEGTCQDITERKQAEEKLRYNKKILRAVLDNAPVGIWMLNEDGRMEFVNELFCNAVGISEEQFIEVPHYAQLYEPEVAASCMASDREALTNEGFNTSYEKILFTDGKMHDLEIIKRKIYDDHNGATKLIGIAQDITERKITEEKLRESEEKYRGLVENSPDGIVIYVDEKIAYINDEGLNMLGAKSRKEVIGKPVLQFVPPENHTSIIQRMKDVMLDQFATATVEEKFIRIDGIPFDVEIKAIPTIFEHKAAVQVIVHDVTERKRTQEKILQLSQAVEQSPVTIVITNTKGCIDYVNPKFTETTGYSFDEVIGKNPRVLKSGHTSSEEYKELWQTIAAGKEWHGEFHNKKKNGELFWESSTISPIVNSQGKTTHFIAIKEDITSRKAVEQELVKAKEQAEESDRLKLAFLANMSHEIRTPMNGILGFTELLKEPKLTGEEQQEYIEIIEKSGKRMLNIINDIINISKVESGQIEIKLSETNVNEQIEYLNTFFKPETKQKGLKLSIKEVLSPKDCIVITDREKIYAILTNLVKNAVKFTNSGSINFGCVKKGKFLEFFVKDTGLGIPKSQHKMIFERFRQANETMTRTHEGSGLGLAISKAYVEMLGGKIWVENEVGKGSTFYFTIPISTELEPEEKIKKKKETPKEGEENKIKDLKILIVEDDAISKLLITIAVKPYSKEILKVSTGFEAVEACRTNPDIDLVMMDINMPEMGGYEATKLIREFNKDLVIIAQTANGMQSDRDNAIAAGCTDYISKPVNITSLAELIQKYFRE